MPDIHHLIELLKSDNPNKRYDACEELRVSRQPLPKEAIDALQFATSDSNPDVADAAQRALALHANTSDDMIQTDTTNASGEAYPIVLGSAVFTAIGLVFISRAGDGFDTFFTKIL